MLNLSRRSSKLALAELRCTTCCLEAVLLESEIGKSIGITCFFGLAFSVSPSVSPWLMPSFSSPFDYSKSDFGHLTAMVLCVFPCPHIKQFENNTFNFGRGIMSREASIVLVILKDNVYNICEPKGSQQVFRHLCPKCGALYDMRGRRSPRFFISKINGYHKYGFIAHFINQNWLINER